MSEIWDKSKNFWTDTDRSAARYKAGLDHLTETMILNANRVSKEVDGAVQTIRSIEKQQGSISENLAKALNNQTLLISKLQVSVDSLNGTLQQALGQSLDAMSSANSVSSKTVDSMYKALEQMNNLSREFKEGMSSLDNVSKRRRKAVPNMDGSWTLEPHD